MFGGRIFLRIIMTLVLLGLLAWGGYALFQGGYTQGYQAALAAQSGATGAAPGLPAYAYLPAWGWYGAPFFHPFGLVLGIGFFLFIFFVIGGLFRFGGRRYYGGGPGHWGHGPDPEFMKEWEARVKERAEKEKEANSNK